MGSGGVGSKSLGNQPRHQLTNLRTYFQTSGKNAHRDPIPHLLIIPFPPPLFLSILMSTLPLLWIAKKNPPCTHCSTSSTRPSSMCVCMCVCTCFPSFSVMLYLYK